MTGRSDGGGDCGGNSPNVKINEESFAETCKKKQAADRFLTLILRFDSLSSSRNSNETSGMSSAVAFPTPGNKSQVCK